MKAIVHIENTRAGEIIRNFFQTENAEQEIRRELPGLYPRLWRFCVALTGSRAASDDLAQATALRAIENAGSYQPGTHLDRWLFVMARRIWLNEKRADQVRKTGQLVPIDEIELPATSSDTEANIFARQVFDQVMALPVAQRMTVLLVYVEGHSYREAAEILDIPIGTVMSRLSAARKAVQIAQAPQRTARR